MSFQLEWQPAMITSNGHQISSDETVFFFFAGYFYLFIFFKWTVRNYVPDSWMWEISPDPSLDHRLHTAQFTLLVMWPALPWSHSHWGQRGDVCSGLGGGGGLLVVRTNLHLMFQSNTSSPLRLWSSDQSCEIMQRSSKTPTNVFAHYGLAVPCQPPWLLMVTPPAVLSTIINNYDTGTDNGLPSFPVQVPRTAPVVWPSVCECKRYAISFTMTITWKDKKRTGCVLALGKLYYTRKKSIA